MYWCIYLYVIIGGIGKTYAAQDKHSSHGERDNKGIKRVYNPRYSRLRIQTIENVIYLIYIARSLYDRYAAGKATHIPSCSNPNTTFDLFY